MQNAQVFYFNSKYISLARKKFKLRPGSVTYERVAKSIITKKEQRYYLARSKFCQNANLKYKTIHKQNRFSIKT